VSGDIGDNIVNGSAMPFRYDMEYELTQELTEKVSDNYPIEVLIQGMVVIIMMCMRKKGKSQETLVHIQHFCQVSIELESCSVSS